MSFESNETSLQDGSPIELYELNLVSETFRFTSSEEPFVVGVNTYDAIEVSRSEISVGTQSRTQIINFSLPSDHSFVQKYRVVVPGQRATLTILRVHRYDSPGFETTTIFKGIVQSVAFTEDGESASVAVMPLTGALGRQVPRFTFQGLCANVLFDGNCKVDAGSFEFVGNASAITGDNITVDGLLASKGANWADGGYVQTVGGTDFRLILEQSTDVIKVLLPFPSDTTILNTNVSVFAGCSHTLAVCKSKFDNVINYGGFQFVPTKNIFGTGL